ncbi:MAG: hypothetical protein H5T86_02760 [Armatimonadetes bacterium]|nr:hypothetical protein [Armatimonadota bacterium]
MSDSSATTQRWTTFCAAAAVAVGLAVTAPGVFSARVLARYASSPDSVDIARWAAHARWGDVLSWWAGPWIQASSPYYRPLSSIAFWLECKAFGMNFQGHVLISWLLHGAVCLLLFRAAITWLLGDERVRAALALLAVALFNARLGPAGPHWRPAPITYGVVAWWPAQTDQFCLLFSLAALLCFDAWLTSGQRKRLGQAFTLWFAALLFKEMAVCVPLVAAALVLYRRGLKAARLRAADERAMVPIVGRLGIGLLWQVLLAGFVLVAAYLAIRSALVPGAWGPKARPAAYFFGKIIWFVAERPVSLLVTRWPWLLIISAYVAACIYVYARLPRRPSAVWLVLALILGSAALAQIFGGTFALITVPREIGAIATGTIFLLGLAVLAHARSGPTWPLLGMVIAIHLPILHVRGPHYMYWPAAFWGLFHASLVGVVVDAHKAGTLQWRLARLDKAVGGLTEGTGQCESTKQ